MSDARPGQEREGAGTGPLPGFTDATGDVAAPPRPVIPESRDGAASPEHARAVLSAERQLLRAAALGDLGAWDALVDAHAAVVWSTCLRCGLPPDEAVTVCQLVWLDLVDALPHLGMPIDTWLVASATLESEYANVRAASGRGEAGHRGDRRRRARRASGVKG